MREIKFRAWDGQAMSQNSKTIKDLICYGIKSGDPEKLIWLQYTGLKDKNGKEIYEGDIVDLQPDQDNKIWHRVIEYDTAAFHCRAIHTSANHPLHFHKFAPDRNWVVIGNIYENPELT